MQNRIPLTIVSAKPNPVDYRFCKAESCFLSFMQSRILRTFVAGDLCPAAFIFYISVYFYIVFIRKRFKAGEKNSGRFCQGDRENGNMRQNKENKKSPERLLFTYLLCIRA